LTIESGFASTSEIRFFSRGVGAQSLLVLLSFRPGVRIRASQTFCQSHGSTPLGGTAPMYFGNLARHGSNHPLRRLQGEVAGGECKDVGAAAAECWSGCFDVTSSPLPPGSSIALTLLKSPNQVAVEYRSQPSGFS
jgi:hypothetical protein